MKNLILVVCITLTFSVPCMAQGIAPSGHIGLHGTVWEPQAEIESPNLGFYAGEAYSVGYEGCVGHDLPSSSYIDLLFFSVIQLSFNDYVIADGLLSPLLGIGVMTDHETGERYIVKKVIDGWTPSEACVFTQE